MTFLSRLRHAWRYLRHPGGETHKSRLSRQEALERKRATTEQLRREVALADVERRIAHLLRAEGLNVSR